MDKSTLKSRIESMDLNELVKFLNENCDPWGDCPKIYNAQNYEFEDFLHMLVDETMFHDFRDYVSQITPDDLYLFYYDGTFATINCTQDIFDNIATVDNLVDYYADFDEIDIAWPERIINELNGTQD